MENPCKRDCPKRNGGCHAGCRDYKVYVLWRQIMRERRRKAVDQAGFTIDASKAYIKRAEKRKKR